MPDVTMDIPAAFIDSGRDCSRCEDGQVDRRARRHAVAAAVDAAMPGASEAEPHYLVDQAQRLSRTHHLVLGHTTWESQ
ncbi:hypothetical protein ABZ016_25675 [Streptomyces sp. NPDC006372]|uniref:hypothetical protein n=1 Tax=Streptomyces sp. NPDC006372 TaxID=3155599 RepID=UPI0033BA2AFF